MNLSQFAVIGGTGMGEMFEHHPQYTVTPRNMADNPYGQPVTYHLIKDKLKSSAPFIFIDRHRSSGQFLLPHQLNHQAYMWLLHKLGIRYVFSISAVGGINGHLPGEQVRTGSVIMPEDYFDLTGRSYTFASRELKHPLAFHRALWPPFCLHLRRLLECEEMYNGGTLGCIIVGPRYETRKEVQILFNNGAALAGMNTVVGEVPLAHEAAMHYVAICVVTNMPLEDSSTDAEKIITAGRNLHVFLSEKIVAAIHQINTAESMECRCADATSVFELAGQ